MTQIQTYTIDKNDKRVMPGLVPKKVLHYVDNKKFFEALVEYRASVVEATAKGEERPRVTEYIGECFLKIATHLSYKANFINYTYKDDMVSDGIENCLTARLPFLPLCDAYRRKRNNRQQSIGCWRISILNNLLHIQMVTRNLPTIW